MKSSKIRRIFIVDDDNDDHFIFNSALYEVRPDIEVIDFYDCEDLSSNLKNETIPLPDLIFLDLNMPGNAGNLCLKEIKRTARTLSIPVIIYSTSDHPKGIKESVEAGALDYVIKKPNFEETQKMLLKVISQIEKEESPFPWQSKV